MLSQENKISGYDNPSLFALKFRNEILEVGPEKNSKWPTVQIRSMMELRGFGYE